MESGQDHLSELPLDGVGTTLLRAREAAGLKLSDISARTRIAERHLQLIEQGKFSSMASRAYAIGFARSYARALGLDERAIADAVGSELAGQEPNSERYQPSSFEPGDPARVPSARLAWIAALGALAAVVIGFVLWRSFYAPSANLPAEPAIAASAAASAPAAEVTALPAAQGAVVFTALEPGVWVKFYDAAGKQLMQKQMALGESYTVPADANGPMIRTARPDALQVSVAGQVVPKLAERQVSVIDVPVSASALLARPSAPATAAVAAAPLASPSPAHATAAAMPNRGAVPTPQASAAPASSPGPIAAGAPPPPASSAALAPAQSSTVTH